MAKEDLNVLDDYIIEYFNELEEKFAMPIKIDYSFLANLKQKKLIKITKISDPYSVLLNSEILVTVNPDYFDNFDDQSKRILFEKEIDKIEVNFEMGTVKIGTPKLNTSFGLVKKHTLENIENAIKLEDLYEKQKQEKEKEKREKSSKKSNWKK